MGFYDKLSIGSFNNWVMAEFRCAGFLEGIGYTCTVCIAPGDDFSFLPCTHVQG